MSSHEQSGAGRRDVPLDERMQARLDERAGQSALRRLRELPAGAVDFSSNDYLGLATGRELAHRLATQLAGLERAGSGASRLLGGNTLQTEALEQRAAQFHGAEAGLFFPSGFAAQSGLISTLAARGDTLLYDERVHASAHEGMRLSPAHRRAFRHNDIEHLEHQGLQSSGAVFVLAESIYSMDGDLAPLEELADCCARRGWHLILDEAHAGGLAGANGEGLACQLGLEGAVFARIITYGKAFGVAGGMVLGSATLRQYLINYCRAFIYSTGPLAAQVMAVQEAYELVAASSDARARLRALRGQLIRGLPASFCDAAGDAQADSPSAVVPLHFPGNQAVVELSEFLLQQGLALLPVRAPAVPEGSERLRCCLHAFNTPLQVDMLLEALRSAATALRAGNLS
jgi:8-amino-7-oxononanoate synthase